VWVGHCCPTSSDVPGQALTRRMAKNLGVSNPKMLTPALTYINCDAKLKQS